jgi:hypothetical protein
MNRENFVNYTPEKSYISQQKCTRSSDEPCTGYVHKHSSEFLDDDSESHSGTHVEANYPSFEN